MSTLEKKKNLGASRSFFTLSRFTIFSDHESTLSQFSLRLRLDRLRFIDLTFDWILPVWRSSGLDATSRTFVPVFLIFSLEVLIVIR